MEARLGRDLSAVRVHTGGEAAASARQIGARAYTVGSDVVFGAGTYDPVSHSGRRLIAHELAHVAQQDRAGSASGGSMTVKNDAWEQDANRMANDLVGSHTGPVVSRAPASGAPAVMREPDDQEELKPYRIPGTPLTVIPLEKAGPGESISLFGIRLPYRAVRLTNENEITPLPAIPREWSELPGVVQLKPNARQTLAGGSLTGRNVSDVLQLKPAPPEQPPGSVPRFSLTVRTTGFAIDVTDRVPLSLHPDVVPGTPLRPGGTDAANVRQHALIDPSLAIGKRAFAAGTLSLRDQYPSHYTSPTDISITARSEPLASLRVRETADRLDFGTIGAVRASAFGIGAARGDVQAFVDLRRVDAALAPLGIDREGAKAVRGQIVRLVQARIASLAQQPSLGNVVGSLAALGGQGGIATAVQQVIQAHARPGTSPRDVEIASRRVIAELLGPGFEVQGPIFFGIPIGYGYFRAETTRYLRAPFEGSGIGTPFPSTLATIGPTIIPKGIISDFTTPAGGATLARDWESFALSATIAGKPSLEPGSIGGAGVATGRLAFRLQGFDVVLEGGWRGRAALGRGTVEKDPFRRDVGRIAEARQLAQARFTEDIERTEAGIFAPDLRPAEVLPTGRPEAEFYGTFRIVRRF